MRIIQKKVSRILFDKRVVALDMTAVVAGTKYRGQFEERIRSILNELQKNPNVILFIDAAHRPCCLEQFTYTFLTPREI